jgi:hypothetical protein
VALMDRIAQLSKNLDDTAKRLPARVPRAGGAPVARGTTGPRRGVRRGDRPVRAVPGLRGQLVHDLRHGGGGRRYAHLTRRPPGPAAERARRSVRLGVITR